MRNLFLLIVSLFTFLKTTHAQNTKGGAVENTNPKSTTGNIFTLIVDVSDYQYSDTYDPLQFADVDGRVFYNYMVSSNGGKIPKENIDTLFNDNASASAVLTKLDEFIEKVQANDILYFYFSGHGDAVIAEYPVFLPYDAPPSRGRKKFIFKEMKKNKDLFNLKKNKEYKKILKEIKKANKANTI